MIKLNYKEYCLEIPDSVYLPSEDTYLLLETIQEEIKNKKIDSALEIGAGSAYISLGLYSKINKITLTDINPVVINYLNNLKQKYNLNKIDVQEKDLFKDQKKAFDLIIFNPPYVPSDTFPKKEEIQRLSTDGGTYGRKVILRFLVDLKSHLLPEGVCYLLISSFNNPHYIFKQILKNNLNYKVLKEKNMFFERLIVL